MSREMSLDTGYANPRRTRMNTIDKLAYWFYLILMRITQ